MTIEETIEKYGLYLGIPLFFLPLISTTIVKTAAESTVGTMDPNIVAYFVIGVIFTCLAGLAAYFWSDNRQLRDQLATTRKTVSANTKAALNEHHDHADGTRDAPKKLTLPDLEPLSYKVTDEMMRKRLGYKLISPDGLTSDDIDATSTDKFGKINEAALEMFKIWITKNGSDATKEKMVEAIEKAGLRAFLQALP